MFCPNCGHNREENNKFCTNCGFRFEEPAPEEPTRGTGFAAKVTGILRSDLFLVACILLSASALFSLVDGGIDVFKVLYTIFFWILFANARSKNFGNSNMLRCVSGTVLAEKVVTWVIFGMVASFSLASFVAAFVAKSFDSGIASQIYEELSEELGESMSVAIYGGISSVKLFMIVLGFAFLLIAAVVLLVNLLVINKVHRFTKSLYPSVAEDKNAVVGANAARIALLVMGIISAVIAVFGGLQGDFCYIVANSCFAAVQIILSVIIGRSFGVAKNQH